MKQLFVIVACMLLVASCTTGNVTKENTIKIGFIAPLTGPFAEWGGTIRKGMELALENSDHDFIVDFQDSACEPQKTVTIAQKFFDIEGIKLVIGPGCVTGLRAIAPIAEEYDALLYSTGLLDDDIFTTHDNVINLATQISTEGDFMAKYLAKQGVNKIAIIHGTNYFGQEYGKRLPESFEVNGIRVSSIHPTDLNMNDFRTVILKMMEKNPEAVFIHQGELSIGTFAKQLRELNHQIPIYSYYAAEAHSVLEAGGDAIEGMLYTYPVNIAEESEEKKEFEKRYAEKFGEDKIPSATSFFVYDGIMLLDKALDVCESNDATCISGFFKNYGEYSGISGLMIFQEDGSLIRPFGIKKVDNGEFVWITKNIEGS